MIYCALSVISRAPMPRCPDAKMVRQSSLTIVQANFDENITVLRFLIGLKNIKFDSSLTFRFIGSLRLCPNPDINFWNPWVNLCPAKLLFQSIHKQIIWNTCSKFQGSGYLGMVTWSVESWVLTITTTTILTHCQKKWCFQAMSSAQCLAGITLYPNFGELFKCPSVFKNYSQFAYNSWSNRRLNLASRSTQIVLKLTNCVKLEKPGQGVSLASVGN